MKISELYGRGGPVISFEFFPPATPAGEATLVRTIEALKPLRPGFVSVTRTGTKPREAPVELVTRIRALGIEGAAHVTCIEATREEIAAHCELMVGRGIENVVAIRGDVPNDPTFRAPANGFRYAVDMIRFIRERKHGFCLVGGGHPEGHPECRDLELNIQHLRAKVDAGLDVVITQLFYDNADYFAFVERARRVGVRVPLVPGIMPITNWPQIERITTLSGNQVPPPLRAALERVRDDEAAAAEVGVEWATRQCRDLLRGGAPGIHFYTLNKSPATRAIFENLRREGLVGH
ncbi:MAG TPA: methylenetetrahydrofolate reductase [Candidatus Binatus sp.]|nr:methylenetetrahydrofolate reductase [Candidatus Binatus sp.]